MQRREEKDMIYASLRDHIEGSWDEIKAECERAGMDEDGMRRVENAYKGLAWDTVMANANGNAAEEDLRKRFPATYDEWSRTFVTSPTFQKTMAEYESKCWPFDEDEEG